MWAAVASSGILSSGVYFVSGFSYCNLGDKPGSIWLSRILHVKWKVASLVGPKQLSPHYRSLKKNCH